MKALLIFTLFLSLPWAVLELTTRPGIIPLDYKYFYHPETPTAAPIRIEELSQKMGLVFQHQVTDVPLKALEHLQLWVTGTGASVAVSDVNGDGFPDVYLTSMRLGHSNRLFVNNQDGTFSDATATYFSKPSNTDHVSLKPLFFDCDNDGDQDLLQLAYQCPRFFRNEGGETFTDRTREAGIDACNGVYSNTVDSNNDGLLDIVIASYNILGEDKQFDNFIRGHVRDQYAKIYLNQGDCRFRPDTRNVISDAGLTHVIGVVDTRGLGRKDLWFVTDIGTDKLLLDNGDGSYQDARDALTHSYNRHGMSFDVTYEGASPTPLVFVSHIYRPGFIVEGNALWAIDSRGKFDNIGRELHVDRCGHAWGAKFLDVDRDGDEDLVVSNGFFSQDPTKSYNFSLGLLGKAHRDYMRQAKNWPDIKTASLFGHEKNCLFLRDGERFHPIAGSNPLTTDTLDGRGVAVIDVLQNGTPSILIANQRQPFKVFTIQQENLNRWIGIKLVGRCSNRDALGAKITLHTSIGLQKRWYYPTNGFSAQNEASSFFGMGPRGKALSVEIDWPSGHRDTFGALRVNTYQTFTEGASCVRKITKN